MLTAAERHQLLVEWNDTATDYPRDKCLHQLFEQQVERTPEAVAVVFEDQQLTYRELNERANQLAHHLRRLGVAPQTLVGLCLKRSPELIIGVLGILKAGGAYLPLDAAYPPQRLKFIVEDAAIRFLVTTEALRERLPTSAVQVVCLDGDSPPWKTAACHNPTNETLPDHLAYVIYTSGSTGVPKGVMLEHRSVVNFLHSMRNLPGISERDVVLAFTSISFDMSVLELFLPLIVGARFVIDAGFSSRRWCVAGENDHGKRRNDSPGYSRDVDNVGESRLVRRQETYSLVWGRSSVRQPGPRATCSQRNTVELVWPDGNHRLFLRQTHRRAR